MRPICHPQTIRCVRLCLETKVQGVQLWTAQQFLEHYFEPSASGTPISVAGPPYPVDVDRSWYMGEGPGRYYHPGMFKIVDDLVERHDLAPGAYDLLDFVPDKSCLPARSAMGRAPGGHHRREASTR